MKIKILLFLSICTIGWCNAQQNKVPKENVTIKYERKYNVHKAIDNMQSEKNYLSEMKKNIPKYKIDSFLLHIYNNKSLYKIIENDAAEKAAWFSSFPCNNNIVYNDFTNNIVLAEKNVFDQLFYIKDTINKYEWKITDDYREIAGYNCRKATTIIMDSVYVIAFYTDALVTPTGPESFANLPGTILGIVLPRLNITIMAQSVKNNETEIKPIEKNKNAKITSYQGIEKDANESLKSWGDWRQRILWFIKI